MQVEGGRGRESFVCDLAILLINDLVRSGNLIICAAATSNLIIERGIIRLYQLVITYLQNNFVLHFSLWLMARLYFFPFSSLLLLSFYLYDWMMVQRGSVV